MSGSLPRVWSWSSFLLCVRLEATELSTPVLSKHPAPVVNHAQRVGVGSIEGALAVAPDGDEADIAQHLQVLRRRRLFEPDGVGDLIDRSLLGGNELEDVATARFGNRVERIRGGRGARHGLRIHADMGICQVD